MLNNYTPDYLISYLDGELATEDVIQLELDIEKYPELKAEVAQLKVAKYSVQYLGLQNQVKSIHATYASPAATQDNVLSIKKRRNWLIYIASAAAAGVILFFAINTSSKKISAEDLYASTYKAYGISNTRGTETITIKQQFADKKYEAIINNVAQNTNPAIEDQFFAALSYGEVGQLNRSSNLLQLVIEQNKKQHTILYKDDAEYYLGMSYLKQKDFTKALQLLEPIANNKKHLYADIITETFISSLKKLIQ
jgi:hypothetical protein